MSDLHELIAIVDQQITSVDADLESVTWTSEEHEEYQRICEQWERVKALLARCADLENAARVLVLTWGAWPSLCEAALIRAVEALDSAIQAQGVQA